MNQTNQVTESAQRAKFEEDTFPHLEALWGTALWLTTRWSKAEELVLETMVRAYGLWDSPNGAVSSKARLFRILMAEFSGENGRNRRSTRDLSKVSKLPSVIDDGGQQYAGPSVVHHDLRQLSWISDVLVKGAIARLEVPARLTMILRFQERFSYREIAYITNLSEDTIKATLSEYRRHIPKYLLKRAEAIVTTVHPITVYRKYAVTSEDG